VASLYIKDRETAELATEVARRAGMTKTAVVREALQEFRRKLPPERKKPDIVQWLADYRSQRPLGRPTGLKADKAFFDWLSGEEDV
jgi:antitoxin VapB